MIEGTEVTGTVGAIAAEPPDAARAGARMFAAGGNAMDAAAAACLACGVLIPEAADLGAYVLCGVVREGKSGRVWSLDANSVAPRAAREDMFAVEPTRPGALGINENEYACSVKQETNIYGPLATGVPGFLGGVGTLWEKWGSLKWEQIVEPSRELLDTGFHYGPNAAAMANRFDVIRSFEPALRHLAPHGSIPSAEDIWQRPDLEKTLARLASAGWRDFYDGELGRRIADYVQQTGGILTREDMSSYAPRVTDTYSVEYRDARVHSAVLPNGGLSSLQILRMLDCFEPAPAGSVEYWHRLAEVLKFAWQDRLPHFADPAFADVPVERLLSAEYAQKRVEPLRQDATRVHRSASRPSALFHGTTHVSAADASGNLVSVTMSQGNPFGSCVVIPGTGIILGHGMCRFAPRPGRPNSVAGGKRPLNNVAPLIVSTRERDVALGVRGGRRIISASAQMAQRAIDFGSGCRELAVAPRIHTLDDEPVEYAEATRLPAFEQLEQMGHTLRAVKEIAGAAHCAEFDRRTRTTRAGGSVWAAAV